ncbi:amino acid adenylation domain-containing protein [Paraneptunicella aestuarii]|uniref:non-ribosomal peptide synthetase/type I polyketide synthase n=1 Tax=Paraneptunicella aestuarii TaxID=2831148 RepID=UPI001E2E0DB6|nr:non-ribosomal peptide synthetase/type I polyketide synthase [Paraneptunicella aestuarii]UAA40607.1 amino acid adenylation domain-containing protein [Paraneptunicella aestuarii]
MSQKPLSAEKQRLFELLKAKKSATEQVKNTKAAFKSAEPFSLISEEDKALLLENNQIDLEDAYPVGQIQLGMLYHMEFDEVQHESAAQESGAPPDSLSSNNHPPDYHNVTTFRMRFKEAYQHSDFVKAVNAVVANQSNYRTTFDLTSYSEPLQLIHKACPITVPYEDLRSQEPAQQQQVIHAFIERENLNPVDMTCLPLVRFYIHQLEDNQVSLTFTEPHSIADGWSLHLAFVDIVDAYLKYRQQQEVVFTQPKTSYADFIRAEKQALQSQEAKTFWRSQLAECVTTVLPKQVEMAVSSHLPQQFELNTHIDAHRGRFTLPANVVQALRKLVQRTGFPMKAIFLAAHFRVLSLVTGQRKVTTGLSFNGRLEVETAEQVRGMFLNTLPVTLDLTGGTWLQLIEQAHKAEMAIVPYRRYPVSALTREFNHGANKQQGDQILFDTMVSFLHFHSMESTIKDGHVEIEPTEDLSKSNFGLAGHFHMDTERENSIQFIGDADLNKISRSQFLAMLDYYQRVIAQIAFHPDSSYHTEHFLPKAEYRKLMTEWQGAKLDCEQVNIPAMFEQQVARTPNAIALQCKTGSLTYQALNEKANALAHYLISQGIKPDSLVAICFERTLDMVIAQLAILKAGGAYVPMDPAYPKDRLAYYLQDSKAAMLLTQEKVKAHLSEIAEETLVISLDDPAFKMQLAALEQSQEQSQKQPLEQNPNYEFIGLAPHHLAYVIYTSGSTGKPKGVMVEHGNTVAFLQWCLTQFSPQELSRVLFSTSVCFDLSIFELFVPLSCGGTVVLVDDVLELTALSDDKADEQNKDHLQQLTLINTVPSAIKALLKTGDIPDSVTTVNLAGEPLSQDVVVALYARGVEKVYDLYGPSEDTTYSTYCLRKANGIASIGRPIANTQAYVLDSHQQPVPIGVPGELYLAGAGIARGYLNRKEQTDERFCYLPWLQLRAYRTGDLVRYLPDGNLVYLGRMDDQVKIRGFRIELGEIQTRLLQQDMVKEVVVIACSDDEGQKRLVAYLVLNSSQNDSFDEQAMIESLTRALQVNLPAYMIPGSFVVLEALPLTLNGKVDKRALPKPDFSNLATRKGNEYVAPETPLQQQLCVLWESVLPQEKIGIHDNFFAAGGDSILAIQLVSKARKNGVRFSAKQLMKHQTISELARELAQVLACQLDQELDRELTQIVSTAADQSVSDSLLIARVQEPTTLELFSLARFPLAQITQEEFETCYQQFGGVDNLYPASPLQQGMWFHSVLDKRAYLNQLELNITGELNVEAFKQAWQRTVGHFEALRTVFVGAAENLHQWVLAAKTVNYEWFESEQELTQLSEYLEQDRERGFLFDNRNDDESNKQPYPLARFALFKLRNAEQVDIQTQYRFIWTYHHSLLDGWSLPLVFKQLMSEYYALLDGVVNTNAEFRAVNTQSSGAQFIAWLQAQDKREALAFWQQYLQGIELPSSLAMDAESIRQADSIYKETGYQDLSYQETGYKETGFTLSSTATQRLQQKAREWNVTMNTVLQYAWAMLLHQYGGHQGRGKSSDNAHSHYMVIGSPVAVRPDDIDEAIEDEEMEDETIQEGAMDEAVGLFLNTLPVKVNCGISAQKSIQQLHQDMQKVMQYSYVSLAEIQKQLEQKKIASSPGQSLFDTLLAFENYPLGNAPDAQEQPLNIEVVPGKAQTNHKLTLSASLQPSKANTESQLSLKISYLAEHFASNTVSRLTSQLEHILQGLGESTGEETFNSGLPDAESALIREWNQTQVDFPDNICIHQLFEQQVKATPKAIALIFNEQQLTYEELNNKANQVAHYLIQQEIKQHDLVGVYMLRSVEMVVALLAIQKAGAAYVPLDPDYPEARLEHVLQDTALSQVLSHSKLQDKAFYSKLAQSAGKTITPLDQFVASNFSAEKPDVQHTASQLAYIIYTSGSTGLPKGVMIEHKALVNRIHWMQSEYKLDASDVVLQKTPFSFDVSVWEFFWPLITGAKLVMAEPDAHKFPEYLAEVIQAQKVTTLHFVPSMLNAMLHSGLWSQCDSVRRTFCSGEALNVETVKAFHRASKSELHNLYGPTEAAIDVSYWQSQPENADALNVVPIGKPIQNIQLQVLNEQFQPVPIGGIGELYIGGIGLARGYLNRDELTKERFIELDINRERNRYYRTGDLARWLPNGELEYLGRNDHQIKLRGYRIELGEIEAKLRSCEQVQDAVVLVASIPASSQASASSSSKAQEAQHQQLVAYVVFQANEKNKEERLLQTKRDLARDLPSFMVPDSYVVLDALPLTSNGKLDRKALPKPDHQHYNKDRKAQVKEKANTANARNRVESLLQQAWQDVLGLEFIDLEDSFFELGGNSLLAVTLKERIQQALQADFPDLASLIKVTDIFTYPSVAAMSGFLRQSAGDSIPWEPEVSDRHTPQAIGSDIAIIGMSGKFPDASNVDEFWHNLLDGHEALEELSDDELRQRDVPLELVNNPDYVKRSMRFTGREWFDNDYFHIPNKQASMLDPQNRLLLQTAVHCLEDAGYPPYSRKAQGVNARIGVYVGKSSNIPWLQMISAAMANTGANDATSAITALTQVEKDFLATQISYYLNLTGPSINVSTACSTSLVAVAEACKALMFGECEMALAGGVSLMPMEPAGYLHQGEFIESKDGHCRPFDRDASGMVQGNGAGLVLLKPLSLAMEDNDQIHAIIKGWGLNNDGAQKTSFGAPNLQGQAEVIREAYRKSGIEPGSIHYIETHGTGTYIGDPVELGALSQVFSASNPKTTPCWLGAVKANIGHLDAAAGVAGLIKAVQVLKTGIVPPNRNFHVPNPELAEWVNQDGASFATTPFAISNEVQKIESEGARRAAVSSFGIGGTNVHLILEQALEIDVQQATNDNNQSAIKHLLPLSAKDESALKRSASRLLTHLEARPELSLADVAYTLQTGRRHHSHRLLWQEHSLENFKASLRHIVSSDSELTPVLTEAVKPSDMVFMFPGQGSQYAGMFAELYQRDPSDYSCYRENIDACIAEFERQWQVFAQSNPTYTLDVQWLTDSLRSILCAPKPVVDESFQTELVQPALFCVEYALAKSLMEQGGTPKAMIGHSLGEYVAATLSGVFELSDAIKLVTYRSQLMQSLEAGRMISVQASQDVLQTYAQQYDLSIAAINGDRLGVLSGSIEKTERFLSYAQKTGMRYRLLNTSHAFHSSMLDPVLPAFREVLSSISLHAPKMPFISNVTGEWITSEQATDSQYWVEHLRGTVMFYPGVQCLTHNSDSVYLEVGPGNTLTGLLGRYIPEQLPRILSADKPVYQGVESENGLQQLLVDAWLQGANIDWDRFNINKQGKTVSLPGYPFAEKAHAVPKRTAISNVMKPQTRFSLDDCTYLPIWKPVGLAHEFSPIALSDSKSVLLFTYTDETQASLGSSGITQQMASALKTHLGLLDSAELDVYQVHIGSEFKQINEQCFEINPEAPADYQRLLQHLQDTRGAIPELILHAWNLTLNETDRDKDELTLAQMQPAQTISVYSGVYLAQALSPYLSNNTIALRFISSNAHPVPGDHRFVPQHSGITAVSKIIGVEYNRLSCQSIDVDLSQPNINVVSLAGQILAEAFGFKDDAKPDDLVAIRHGMRFLPSYEQVRLPEVKTQTRYKEQGVYLIVGGLGGMGLVFAEHIAKHVNATIVLLNRSTFIARDKWEEYLLEHASSQQEEHLITCKRIRAIQHIEKLSSRIVIQQADVANRSDMTRVIEYIYKQCGQINGLIHSAGVVDYGGIIQRRDKATIEQYTRSKIQGTLLLDELLEGLQADHPLDFMILGSSIANVAYYSRYAQVGYAIANEFLDCFSYYKNSVSETFTSTINWDDWYEDGMSAQILDNAGRSDFDREQVSLLNDEGEELYSRILNSSHSRVVVSTQPLTRLMNYYYDLVMSTYHELELSDDQTEELSSDKQSFSAEEIREQVIAAVTEVFGTQDVSSTSESGERDGELDFVALGGDSLIALQLINNLQKRLGIRIGVEDIFADTRISSITNNLIKQHSQNQLMEVVSSHHNQDEDSENAEHSRETGLI